MPALLVLAFIVVPLVELYLIIQVGQVIGAPLTIAILVADSILGSVLLRSQGRAAWRRFEAAWRVGRPPAREVLDGALIIFGGALLLTPGFVTDVLGLFLLIPPTRAVVRRALVRIVAGRFVAAAAGARAVAGASRAGRSRAGHRRARPSHDVEGTAVEMDQPPPGR